MATTVEYGFPEKPRDVVVEYGEAVDDGRGDAEGGVEEEGDEEVFAKETEGLAVAGIRNGDAGRGGDEGEDGAGLLEVACERGREGDEGDEEGEDGGEHREAGEDQPCESVYVPYYYRSR